MRTLLAALAIALLPALAIAQAPAPAAAQAPPATQPTEGALQPQGYTYSADGRRDPFVSLLRRGVEAQSLPDGARPPGLAGLGTSEVTLKGTMRGREGYVGILLGADTKQYLVRPGDKLLDGTVRSVSETEVVILQQVNDPLSLQKQREVRKGLRQTEEAK
jgi:Tfp pilus assembly protein PilP